MNKLDNIGFFNKESANEIKLNFEEDGYFTCRRDLNFVMELHDYTKAFLYSVSHMITHDGRLKYDNNRIIPSLHKLKDFLKISNEKWNKYIKPDVERCSILKKEKVNNVWYLFLNPIYAKHQNFILTLDILNLFHNDIINNISYFINDIRDIDVLERLKDNISEQTYSYLEFKINPNKHYIVSDEPPKLEGVYFLYHNDTIVYIGKSKNIYDRVSQHRKDKQFNKVKSIIFKDASNIDLYEPYLINKYKPALNKDFIRDDNGIQLPEIKLQGRC